jgi:hypothetical protein
VLSTIFIAICNCNSISRNCALPGVLTYVLCVDWPADAFDFASYMADTAKSVQAALDTAVPAKYPETLNESMR